MSAAASSRVDPDRAARLHQAVIHWQGLHGRHGLPWQATRDPYRVWLSEVMLQQTQVGTVLGYYERFLARFPDLASLAAAPQDEVLALWSGLGYYSRARMLHRCAQQVVAVHGGQFPASAAALASLPGIGRSTAAAIAAFCFGERAAILDGNVKRVLARALGFAGDLAQPAQERLLWQLAESLLPPAGVGPYTQGLMDLGATVCTLRRPACTLCPLAQECVASREGRPEAYPVKTRKLRRSQRSSALLWLQQDQACWLVRRPQQGVWAGLWSLPEYPDEQTLQAQVAGWPGQGRWLPPLRHALTHFDWTLQVLHWHQPAAGSTAAEPPAPWGAPAEGTGQASSPPQAGRWFSQQEALALGLPAPVRRLLEQPCQASSALSLQPSAEDDLLVPQVGVDQR